MFSKGMGPTFEGPTPLVTWRFLGPLKTPGTLTMSYVVENP